MKKKVSFFTQREINYFNLLTQKLCSFNIIKRLFVYCERIISLDLKLHFRTTDYYIKSLAACLVYIIAPKKHTVVFKEKEREKEKENWL